MISDSRSVRHKWMKGWNEELPEAFVLGMNITGLHCLRSLGRRGVPVRGFDWDGKRIGFRSRYGRKVICPHPRKEENSFLDFLIHEGRNAKGKAVLIASNDEYLLCISRNREALDRHFLYSLPCKEVIEGLNNKGSFYRMAVAYGYPVPRTFSASEEGGIKGIAEKIGYPCILKAKYAYDFQELGVKAIRVDSKKELVERYQRLGLDADKLVVQEIVPGEHEEQYSLYSYFNRDSLPVATVTSRKARQYPIEFGVGSLVESCEVERVREIGISLLQQIRYKGLCEIEFKWDREDRTYKVIEVNTRPWVQMSLARRCGVDFCFLYYSDLAGRNPGNVQKTSKNVKWVCFEWDFYACFGSSGYRSKNLVTLRGWLSSLRGDKEFAYFSWDDARPFLYESYSFLKDFAGRLKKKALPGVGWNERSG